MFDWLFDRQGFSRARGRGTKPNIDRLPPEVQEAIKAELKDQKILIPPDQQDKFWSEMIEIYEKDPKGFFTHAGFGGGKKRRKNKSHKRKSSKRRKSKRRTKKNKRK